MISSDDITDEYLTDKLPVSKLLRISKSGSIGFEQETYLFELWKIEHIDKIMTLANIRADLINKEDVSAKAYGCKDIGDMGSTFATHQFTIYGSIWT